MIEFIDSYFFDEVSAVPYATLRILVGLLFIGMWIEMIFSYEMCAPIGQGGLIMYQRNTLWNVPTIFRFGCSFKLYMVLHLISAICITIGFFSVVFLIFMLYLHISFRSYASGLVGGSDQILHAFCFWLIFSNPDAIFSVTSLIMPEDHLKVVPYAGRGLIANITLFYCLSVILKFKGKDWRDGMAVWNVMNFPDRHKWRFPTNFLVNKNNMIRMMTYYVLVVETLTPIGFFVKPLIPVWIFLLFCMHIGIELTMFVGLFGYCMFAFLIFLFLTYLYW